jgi:gamma-glutamylcyclotransferase (GGCT)/AIG2-like uncharacterized protein YtfP
MATQLLFIYGTLLQSDNEFALYLQKNSSPHGKGKFKGKLYDIGEYPGAILTGDAEDHVHGHIVLLNDTSVLKNLDRYEGYGPKELKPNLFIRKRIAIETETGLIECWVYFYNLPIDGLHQITSGEYVSYKKGQKKSPGV